VKVLVAGATGVVGRALLPRLIQAGHDVTALVRHATPTGGWGWEQVVGDAFDADLLTEIVVHVRPDVVINQMTSLPASASASGAAQSFEDTARLRTVGMANLVAAANRARVGRLVTQSLAAYAPVGPMVATEDTPLYVCAPGAWGSTVAAVSELERQAFEVFRGDAVVLRYAQLYGPGTWWGVGGDLTDLVRGGHLPLIGDGAGVTSFLHVEDAAQAAGVAASSHVTGIFNVADDEPAPASSWLPALATALGATPPPHVDVADALLSVGEDAVFRHTKQRGADHRRAHQVLGLGHIHPTWRTELGPGTTRGDQP
jgi:nucleoside-diphosphate-sugar epimerase